MLPVICVMLAALTLAGQAVPKYSPADINIPYKKYVLSNGLRLIVHEDHKAPIVAVNVWYHVGSKNEKPGKSGFAHLFEHLMFNGSENFNDDYFQVIERIGGTDVNGTTHNDHTNYFQNVPVPALDQVLFLESDRMGHLLGAIDQAKLDEQRGVVQNEKRQGENQPYGRQWEMITKAMFPPGHPYSWTVIGSMDDLNAASLEDVHEWFKGYYGAANAVIAIAGDINADEVHEKVKKYFGDIPSGPTIARPAVNVPMRTGETRETYEDRVPEARITQVWNSPSFGSREDVMLDLVANILAGGKNSRLYKKLVYDDQIATSVSAFESSKEIASNFIIQANVKPGQEVDKIEKELINLLNEFLKNGATQEELDRAKAETFTGFIKGIERIGGFGGKSDILASNEVYHSNPEYYKTALQYTADATLDEVVKVARKYLSDGKHTLICTPFPQYSVAEPGVDRSKGLPEMGQPVAAKFPDLQRATLKNGMKVVLAQRSGSPTIVMNTIFDAGYAADQGGKPGTASLSMNMLDEGTKTKSALEINDMLGLLGASLGAGSDLDASYVNMTTLKPALDPSLDLYADVLMNPAFPQADFDRLQNQQLTNIQREKSNPVQMALRIMPKFLYGEGHAYSLPLTGSGYEETVKTITRDDVVKFYGDWVQPSNATIMVVGDISMAELTQKLEARLGAWKGSGKMPKKNIAAVPAPAKGSKLYLMDRPESPQSVIIGGYLVDGYGKVDEMAREALINIMGGEFTSRLNMNLREDKHWAYGAFTFIQQAKGQRPMLAYAPVQSDKTKESVEEIIKEFKMAIGDKPVTKEEFSKTTGNAILSMSGQWETNGAVAGSINEIVKYGLADNYFQTYDQRMRNMQLSNVQQLAPKLVKPDAMQFFVVGDKEKILPSLKELGFDEIILVDADGKPVGDASKAKP